MRHYLQDVGSTFGTGANGPREYDEGWELLYDGSLLRKRFVTLNFFIAPWQTVDYAELPAIGRFEGDRFDPPSWQPRVSTAALRHARSDDTFWAARRVAAFTDDMIRAVVRTGKYSDPAAEALLADVLIKRRQKIAAAYLTAINPLVDFALAADGRLSFRNAAVDAGVARASRERIPRRVVGVRQHDRRHARDRAGRDVTADHACRRRGCCRKRPAPSCVCA